MKPLEQLRREAYEKKHGHPVHRFFESEFKVKKPKTAAQLEALISEYCTLSGWVCTNIYGGGRRVVTKHQVTDVLGRGNMITEDKFIPSQIRKGHSDLIISIDGRTFYIEVKLNDRQSEDQKKFEGFVVESGAVYFIVRSIDDFINLLK